MARVALCAAWLVPCPFAFVMLTGCTAAPPPVTRPQSTSPASDLHRQTYLHQVRPILQAKCARCHDGMNRRGGLSMSKRALLMQGGKDGVVVIPGRPEDSLLIKTISGGMAVDDPLRMPQKGSLTAAEIATLRKWVADGAWMDR